MSPKVYDSDEKIMKKLPTTIFICIFSWVIVETKAKHSDHGTVSRECEKEEEDFVSKFSLCNSQEPDDLVLGCRHRCGVKPSWKESHERCSCDDKCIVYNDCCPDFHSRCPDVSLKAKVKYPTLSESYAYCKDMQIKVITSCQHVPHVHIPPPVTRKSTTFIPTEFVFPSSTTNTPMGTELEKFFRAYPPLVLDLSNDMVFESISIFECYKTEESKPVYLPRASPVSTTSSKGDMPLSVDYAFDSFDLSKWHLSRIPKSIPGMRGCYHGDVVHCRPKKCPRESVSILCEGLAYGRKVARDMSLTIQRPMTIQGKQDDSCRQFLGEIGYYFSHYKKHNVTFIIQPNSMNDQESVLVYKGTPWRKLKCANRRIPVEECEIMECSPGYLKSITGKCFEPTFMSIRFERGIKSSKNLIVTPSFCTCLDVYTIALSLNVWKLGRVDLDSKCRIKITGTVVDLELEDDDHITEVVESIVNARKKIVGLEDDWTSEIKSLKKEHYLDYEWKENSSFSIGRHNSTTTVENNYTYSARSYHLLVESFPSKLIEKLRLRKQNCLDSYDTLFLNFIGKHSETEETLLYMSENTSHSLRANTVEILLLYVTILVSGLSQGFHIEIRHFHV